MDGTDQVSLAFELFAGPLAADIGTLTRVDVRINGTDGWHLKEIEVTLPGSLPYSWAPHEFWLNEDMCEEWTSQLTAAVTGRPFGCTRSLWASQNCSQVRGESHY